jgi:glycosyltransferase involved in cell wall biosynthesis
VRILTVGNMYPPHHLGGYELMWRAAVAHHRAAGHEVRVLTTDWREPYVDASTPEDEDVHRELRWYWHDHDFPRLGPRARLALERHNARTLDRHIAQFVPDVVCWWAMGGMSLSLIGRVRGAGLPAVAVVVDDWLLYGPQVDAWWRLLGRRARRLREACGWLFASRTLLERAQESGFDPPEPEVAYPGIDPGLFRAQPDARHGWAWRLLYCGRIDERKGIDIAVEALPHLPPEARLRIVGGGDDTHLAELRALTARLGLEDRVSFERLPRAELPAAYGAADALLFPVRWIEPFGLVPLEGMACGTPVVTSGRGGSGEYLADGENCLLFDVEAGGGALAAALERLAADPALRERLVAGGSATAERFTEKSFNDAVLAALERSRHG